MACKIIVVSILFYGTETVIATLSVFLTGSSYSASVPCVKRQLVEVCVTDQGTPRDRWGLESHVTQRSIEKGVHDNIIYNSRK